MGVITTIEHTNGKAITHTGTSGFTVTGTREENELNVQIEIGADIPQEEMVALVGTFLTQLEEMAGEGFVARCLSHYALDTKKTLMEAGDHKIAMIRGGNRGKKPKQ